MAISATEKNSKAQDYAPTVKQKNMAAWQPASKDKPNKQGCKTTLKSIISM